MASRPASSAMDMDSGYSILDEAITRFMLDKTTLIEASKEKKLREKQIFDYKLEKDVLQKLVEEKKLECSENQTELDEVSCQWNAKVEEITVEQCYVDVKCQQGCHALIKVKSEIDHGEEDREPGPRFVNRRRGMGLASSSSSFSIPNYIHVEERARLLCRFIIARTTFKASKTQLRHLRSRVKTVQCARKFIKKMVRMLGGNIDDSLQHRLDESVVQLLGIIDGFRKHNRCLRVPDDSYHRNLICSVIHSGFAVKHIFVPPPHPKSIQSELAFEDLPPANEKVLYVMSVKNALGENSPEFSSFYKLVQKYEGQRTGALIFRVRARALLKDHPQLIMGLNIFLPEGYKISDPSPTEHKNQGYIDFLKQVKKHYKHDKQRCNNILSIFNDCRKKKISSHEAHAEVCHLLHDSPDLLWEFRTSF